VPSDTTNTKQPNAFKAAVGLALRNYRKQTLGLVDQQEARELLGWEEKRRSVYSRMEAGEIGIPWSELLNTAKVFRLDPLKENAQRFRGCPIHQGSPVTRPDRTHEL
jgi:hypothetical protein